MRPCVTGGADVVRFISDHEAETDGYNAKKQRCNTEHPAQPTDADMEAEKDRYYAKKQRRNADMLGHLADTL